MVFCVSGKELRNEVEKFRSEDRHRLRTAQLGDRPDELQTADLLLAVVPNVVEEDKRTVRPSGEHGMIEVETLDHRVNIIGPQLRVGVGVVRFVRETMTSQIHRYQSMSIGQARIHLKIPRERRL